MKLVKLELPLVLARKIERIMIARGLTFDDAVIFLVEKVSTPSAKSKGEVKIF